MSTMKSPSVKHVQIFKTKFEWLSRRLSLAGLMSRRQANEVIERGEVTVNGLQAPYNMEVSSAAEIIWKGIRVPYYDTPLLWGVRKPRKVLCTMDDRSDVVTLKQYIHKLKNKAADLLIPDHCFLIHPLPLNAEGLVLLCNDGHFASALQKRDSLIETVRVHGRLPADDLRSLRKGVSINGISYGSVKVDVIRNCWTSSWLQVKLIEDKQKDLYSLFRKYNLEVLRYHRYAYGPYRVSLIDDGGIIPLGIHKSLRHLIPTTRAKSVLLPAADYFFSRPKLNHEAGIRTEDHEISNSSSHLSRCSIKPQISDFHCVTPHPAKEKLCHFDNSNLLHVDPYKNAYSVACKEDFSIDGGKDALSSQIRMKEKNANLALLSVPNPEKSRGNSPLQKESENTPVHIYTRYKPSF